MTKPTNPFRELLEQQMGIDAFSLDGNDTEVQDRWSDAPRDPAVRVTMRAPRDAMLVKAP